MTTLWWGLGISLLVMLMMMMMTLTIVMLMVKKTDGLCHCRRQAFTRLERDKV